MNRGVEILLKRMESNPEEFTGPFPKWGELIERAEDYMEPEDRKALMDKFNALQMEKFTERVMKKLLAAEEEQPALTPFGQAAMGSAGSIQGLYTAAGQAGQAGMTGAQSQLAQQQYAMQNAAQNAYANTSAISFRDSNQAANSIQLGKQTLTERTLKKLKALIK